MKQPPLFPGMTLRDAAIEQVEVGNTEWVDEAESIARDIACRHTTLTTDDLWPEIERRIGPPRERRAMAAVLRRLQAADVLEPTSAHTLSAMRSCHARPKRVWRVTTSSRNRGGKADL